MSQSPNAEQFVGLVDKLRKRGAVRVSWGLFAADFLPAPADDAPSTPARALGEEERRRLDELEERYARDEELGAV